MLNAYWLWQALERLQVSPKGEYYLTDLVGLAVSQGMPVASVTIEDEDEVIGVNNRVQTGADDQHDPRPPADRDSGG